MASTLFMVLMGFSCSSFPKPESVIEILPRETDLPGWVVSKQAVVYEGKDIRLVCPEYARYDPLIMARAEYHYLSDINKTVRVEVLGFGSSLDSFGLYSLERGWNIANRFLGDDDYINEKGRFSRLGNFYIKIAGETLGERREGTLDQFHAAVFRNLKRHVNDDSFPSEIFLLSDDRSTRETVFYKKGLPAIPASENLYVTRRNMFEKKYKIFYMKRSSVYDSEHEFHGILQSGGGSFMLSKTGNLETALLIMSEKEYLFISYYKHWIFGVLDAENMIVGNTIITVLFDEIKARAYALHNR
jgi:hypothetical protein